MKKMARECLQANRASMFGFESRSGGWSSIADSVGRRFTPVGNCYVLKPKQRRQYEKQNDETPESDSLVDRSDQAETSSNSCPHDSTCNTGQLLGRDSHVSLRALSGLTRSNPASSGNGAITSLFHAGRLGRVVPEQF